jgi:hypothetical protein
MAMPLLPETTIRYKTYLKRALVEALRQVFANHPDSQLHRTKVSIDYPTSENLYPTVIVRFYEREIRNAGVGHVEYLVRVDDNDEPTLLTDKFRHYLYSGDIEFAVYALSSKDRDLIADTLVQTLAMPDMASYTNNFFNRLYHPPQDNDDYDDARYNFVNLNTDLISGFGETQTQQPWLSEDNLQYQTSYRVGIYGEFYSLPPIDSDVWGGVVERVDLYPYIEDLEEVPTGADDPSEWI